jgi:type II secretory pathway pseudopilin PulG
MSLARGRAARRDGLTLVETAIAVAIVGALLAVLVPAFARSLRTSKISEASEQLDRLSRSVSTYYEAERTVDDATVRACVPGPAGPAPAQPSPEREPVDLSADETPGAATWRAIGHRVDEPVRYRYTLVSASPGCGRTGRALVTLRAEGDLDGDGDLSTFERTLGSSRGSLRPEGVLFERDRTE